MDDYSSMDEQMRELANPVREYYPKNPELAFDYFRKLYPDVVAGTIVTMVWGFIQYEKDMSNPYTNTRPLTIKDHTIYKDPNIRN